MSDIVKGQFTDISPRYTAEMNSLVNVLLSQVSYWLFTYIVIFLFFFQSKPLDLHDLFQESMDLLPLSVLCYTSILRVPIATATIV